MRPGLPRRLIVSSASAVALMVAHEGMAQDIGSSIAIRGPYVYPAGLKGGSLDDDTQAIQNACDANPGRTIMLPVPQAQYNISSPIRITAPGTWLGGENVTQTKIINKGSGDGIVIGPSNPGGGVLQGGNGVFNLTVSRLSNVATGAALKVQVASRCAVNNVQLLEHFNNLHQIATNTCQFSNMTMGGGSVFAGAAGSASVRQSSQALTAGGILRCQVVQIMNSTIGGGSGIWVDCWLIESGDTTFATNVYIASPTTNLIHIKAADASSPIVSVNLNQVYLDGVNTGGSLVGMFIESDGQGTSSPSFITLSDCTVGQLGRGVVSTEPGLGRLIIGGCTEFHNIEHEAIKVSGASAATVQVAGALFYACGRQNADVIVSIDGARAAIVAANLADAAAFTSNTFLKLSGTMSAATVGPNALVGFATKYDTGSATVTDLETFP